MAVAVTLAACSAATDEEVDGDHASVKRGEFDKNTVLTDADLRDTTSLSVADIQAFLEETPWGQPSVLATYEEGGKSAAEIMHEAAAKHGINPLELLVRAQMEQSLINKETASEESLSLAFGCGCPHSPVCSPKYEGFANQADCAAGTLSRSMARALTSDGTASGWKKGEGKLTQDKIKVVPANAATAALYTYTPWVGEAGGGRKGVGGASLHYQVWGRFADAIGYGVTADSDSSRTSEDLGASASGGDPNDDEEAIIPGHKPEYDAGAPPTDDIDTGAPSTDDIDAGAPSTGDIDAGAPSTDNKESRDPAGSSTRGGSDDDDLLSEGNAPPATNAPPPRESTSRSRSSRGGNEDLTEATDKELAGKAQSTGGCSSTGGSTSDASLFVLAMATASIVAKRRRKA